MKSFLTNSPLNLGSSKQTSNYLSKASVPSALKFLKRQWTEALADFKFLARTMIIVFSLMAVLYSSTLLMLLIHQEKFIFKPKKSFSSEISIWGTKDHHIQLPWKDGQAHAHLFLRENSSRSLIYFYGNASNIDTSIEKCRWLSQFVDASIFVADYPGYGQTTGEPGQKDIADLMEVWDRELTNQWNLPAQQRLIWGHSLGGAVASQFAAKHGAFGLILENTFNSMIDMAGEAYPFMPIRMVCRHPFDSDLALKNWNKPTLIYHSEDDHVVPIELGIRLKESLPPGSGHWVVTRGRHNQSYQESQSRYTSTFRSVFPSWTTSTLPKTLH